MRMEALSFCQTVSEFLSIPIHKYFIVKADGVEQMINTIGGVKVRDQKRHGL